MMMIKQKSVETVTKIIIFSKKKNFSNLIVILYLTYAQKAYKAN